MEIGKEKRQTSDEWIAASSSERRAKGGSSEDREQRAEVRGQRSAFCLEHGAAATRGSTETSRFFRHLTGDRFVHLQGVVVKKLFARPQIAQCVNENSPVLFDGFAVWIAGMIDPARFVSARRRVDHILSIVEAEQECMRVVEIVRDFLPQNSFSG